MAEGTARQAIAITPSDATVLNVDALYVGVAGTVVAQDRDGTQVTWTVPAGGYVLCSTTKVMAASTATGIIGLTY